MFGRPIFALLAVLLMVAAPWCPAVAQDIKTCQTAEPARSIAICSQIIARGDQASPDDYSHALLYRGLSYATLCRLPQALADLKEFAKRNPQDEAVRTNIRQIEQEIAAGARIPARNGNKPDPQSPPDAVTWSCVGKWGYDVSRLRSFVDDAPQSIYHDEAKARLAESGEEQNDRQTEFDGQLLFGVVGGTALGGIILVALLVPGWRSFAWSALFGLLAGIIVAPLNKTWITQPIINVDISSILLGVIAALCARAIAGLFLEKWLDDIRTKAPAILVPERWPGMEARTTLRDQVRRWFVTVSAAAGSVVGAMIGLDLFWAALASALELRSILFSTILVGVSLFLSGPLQSYIFDAGARADHLSDPTKKIHDVLAANIDRRGAIRLSIVLILYLGVYLLSSCVGAAIKHGDPRVVSVLLAAATTPAVVSYYWSAALQRRCASVLEAGWEPSWYAGSIMAYGAGLAVTISLLLSVIDFTPSRGSYSYNGAGNAMLLFFSPVIAVLPALLLGAMTTLGHSLAGGFVIDRFPRRHTMIMLAAALALTAAVQGAITLAVMVLMGFSAGNIHFATFIGSIIGWLVGLYASGFPRLLTPETVENQVGAIETASVPAPGSDASPRG